MTDNNISWHSCTVTHQGMVRQHNEDSCLERPDLGLWVVADGLGGHLAGDVASQMIVSELGALEPPVSSLTDLLDRVRQRIQAVNVRLNTISQRHRQLVGTTVAHDSKAACLWAGDSRLYRYAEHKLTQVTTDHTRLQRLIQEGLLSPEEANNDHPAGYVVTRALGAQAEIELEECHFDLQPNSTYLLCSDGLVRHVRDPEIADVLAAQPPDAAAKRLLEMTLERGAADNVTIAVIQLTRGAAENEDLDATRHPLPRQASEDDQSDTEPMNDATRPYPLR
jgi:serine/threonine protein phosphatase PrpC